MSVRSTPAFLAVLLVAALQFGCEETDEALDVETGVTVLGPTDPDLRLASLDDPGIQAIEWTFTQANLGVADGSQYDLTAAETCLYVGSATLLPTSFSKCGGGVVVGQSRTALDSSLAVTFRATARRAQPWVPSLPDHDGDTVPNDVDDCPLIFDPDQEDDNMNGIGDACEGTNPFTGEIEIDNDGDGDIDRLDNCVYIKNPDQRDTFPFDGIGDACDGTVTPGAPLPQEAELAIAMNTDLSFGLDPGGFNLSSRSTIFAVVDLSSDDSLTCDWSAGICELDPTAVGSCYLGSLQTLAIGCNP